MNYKREERRAEQRLVALSHWGVRWPLDETSECDSTRLTHGQSSEGAKAPRYEAGGPRNERKRKEFHSVSPSGMSDRGEKKTRTRRVRSSDRSSRCFLAVHACMHSFIQSIIHASSLCHILPPSFPTELHSLIQICFFLFYPPLSPLPASSPHGPAAIRSSLSSTRLSGIESIESISLMLLPLGRHHCNHPRQRQHPDPCPSTATSTW